MLYFCKTSPDKYSRGWDEVIISHVKTEAPESQKKENAVKQKKPSYL